MTRLSVNINKVATLRNARGGNLPDVVQFAIDCEKLGAQGITVHPRPDERHIRRQDVFDLKPIITTEFNIEGNPTPEFIDLVCTIRPTQVTLVPDSVDQLTSNHGWDTKTHLAKLTTIVQRFKSAGIRVSIFVDADPVMVEYAAKAGADRVELYTGPYAELYDRDPEAALAMYRPAAEKAHELQLGLNAGHDLNLRNLHAFVSAFPWTDEVSIGHAIISDALYLGIAETIRQYRDKLIIDN
ncbi:MAG: pyridoxine 5'-phosphate synthase [Paludibacteraceae bacterium]|nr:pyridoxine 5'-phosphate synthase [Paludibacteraceae bacterium]